MQIKPVPNADCEDLVIQNAMRVEWDDDILKHIYNLRCECGGNYRNVNHFRRSYRLATYDIIECQCLKCKNTKFLPYKPTKIHESVTELIQENIKYVRL